MIRDLIAKLEKAGGASRELDAEIDAALRIGRDYLPAWARDNLPNWRAKHRGAVEVVHYNGVGGLWWDSLPFTGSIDAASALAVRLLPDAQVMIGWQQTPNTKPWARVGAWAGADATGATPAIALVIATLSTFSQQEESKG